MSFDLVKAILKRKKEYIIKFEISVQLAKKKEEEAKKRAREEAPSDDELISPKHQKQIKSSQQKQKQSWKQRRKNARRKSIEEEIVAPKLTPYGTKPPISG